MRSADSTSPASASSSAPSATRMGSVPLIMPAHDDMTCVTRKSRNRHTTRHHQRESPAPGSARQNRYTNPLHTASAGRRHGYATAGRHAKIDWKALSQRIGHSDVAFTMRQYVQTDLEADREVANTLAELIVGGWLSTDVKD